MLILLLTQRKVLFVGGLRRAGLRELVRACRSLQNRFETIIDPSVGPANAQESGRAASRASSSGLKLWVAIPGLRLRPRRVAAGQRVEDRIAQPVRPAHRRAGHARRLSRSLFWPRAALEPAEAETADAPRTRAGRRAAAVPPGPGDVGVDDSSCCSKGCSGTTCTATTGSWYCAFTAVALGACRERLADPDPNPGPEDEADGMGLATCLPPPDPPALGAARRPAGGGARARVGPATVRLARPSFAPASRLHCAGCCVTRRPRCRTTATCSADSESPSRTFARRRISRSFRC